MPTHDEGPGRPMRPRPSATDPNPTSLALQDTALTTESTARARRIAALRGCGAAYEHLRARGLVSVIVVEALRECLRDAA